MIKNSDKLTVVEKKDNETVRTKLNLEENYITVTF